MPKHERQPGLTLSALKSALAKGEIAPLYLLAGLEHFLAQEAEQLIAGALESRGGECARNFYHGDDVDLATVLDNLRTPSLFSPTRFISVSPAGGFVEKYQKALAAYAAAPAANSSLVLRVATVDARKKLTKTAQETGGLVACNRFYERDVVPWVTARVKAMGRQINSAAAALLTEFLGTDLAMLAAELDKLAVYIGDRKKITPEDVQNVSLRDRGRAVYELTDAIGRRQPERALAALDGLLAHGASETSILFSVAQHMRRLWTVKEFVGKGENPVATATKLGVKYYVDRFLAQVNAFSLRELRYNCSALVKCEAMLKSSVIDDKRVMLELTFIRLITRRTRAAPRAS
ncbi:MAG: DNA polymerase III subunit delta [Planctomycetota bacterium]